MTQTRAILYGLIAFFVFSLYDAVIKLGRQAEIPPLLIIAAIGIIGAIGIAGTVVPKRGLSALRPLHFRELILICLCSLATRYCTISSLKYLPLTTFYTVVFSAPLVIAALSLFLKHERFSPIKSACLTAGFGGTLIVLVPGLTSAGEWAGYLFAFVGMFFFSGYTLLMHSVSQKESVPTIQFYNLLFHALVGIVGVVLSPPTISFTWTSAALLLFAGMLFVTASLLYNKALQNTASTNVAQFHYTQIIYGALWGYLIWHDVPTWNLLAGAVLIIGAGMIVAAQTRKNEGQA